MSVACKLFFFFETVSGSVAQASLGFDILLLLPTGSQVLGLQVFITMPAIPKISLRMPSSSNSSVMLLCFAPAYWSVHSHSALGSVNHGARSFVSALLVRLELIMALSL